MGRGSDFASKIMGVPTEEEERATGAEERSRTERTGARAIRAGGLVPSEETIPPGFEKPPAPITAIPANVQETLIEAEEKGWDATWSDGKLTVKTRKKVDEKKQKADIEQTNLERQAEQWLTGYSQDEDNPSPTIREQAYANFPVAFPTLDPDSPKWRKLIDQLPPETVEQPIPGVEYGAHKLRAAVSRDVVSRPAPTGRGQYPAIPMQHTMETGEQMPGPADHPGAIPGSEIPAVPSGAAVAGEENLRQQAIAELQAIGAPITPANIQAAMEQLR